MSSHRKKRWTRRNVAALIVVDVTRLCDVHSASFTCNGGVPVDLNEHEHSLPLQGWSGEIYILFSISKIIEDVHSSQAKLLATHIKQILFINQPTNQQPPQLLLDKICLPSPRHRTSLQPRLYLPTWKTTLTLSPAAAPVPATSSKSNRPRSRALAPTTPPATLRVTDPARPPSHLTLAPPASVSSPKITTPALRASRASLCLLSPAKALT